MQPRNKNVNKELTHVLNNNTLVLLLVSRDELSKNVKILLKYTFGTLCFVCMQYYERT